MGAIAEALMAFAQPLLDQTDGSEEQLNRAFAVTQLCYNLALLPEHKQDTMLREVQSNFKMDDEEFDAFRRSVIVPMIERHHQMFPGLHRRFAADFWEREPTLPAQPRTVAATESHPTIDRYAPCPCGSGEKYKFCCGKKKR